MKNNLKSMLVWFMGVIGVIQLSMISIRGKDMYGGGPYAQPMFLQPTFRAEDFIDFLGISGGVPPEPGQEVDPRWLDLGIRYYRVALWDTRRGRDNVPEYVSRMVKLWKQHGRKIMILLDTLRDTPEQAMKLLEHYPPEIIEELEGGNEVNNKFPPQVLNTRYKGKTDEAAGALWMQDFYSLLKQHPRYGSLPVVAFTAIFTDYRLAKPHDAFDYGNIHSYQGSNEPSSSLEMNITRFNNILPIGATIKPFVVTECGYNVEEDTTNRQGWLGSEISQGRNIPMLLAEYFRHGIRRMYLFNYHNVDGYGLLDDRQQPRPAYYAVRDIVRLLKEAEWNPQTMRWEGGKDFEPRALLFEVPHPPITFRTLSLQKQNGTYYLLLWNELENYDPHTKRERNNPPIRVSIQFRTELESEATLWSPTVTGEYRSRPITLQNNQLNVEVPSTLIIVELKPKKAFAEALPIFAPSRLWGEATENEVRLFWDRVPEAIGYCLYRNGWHIASLKPNETSYIDRSSWIRPGLGYVYEIQSISSQGVMSLRTRAVIQTAPRFPDLVVTDFGIENPHAKEGEKVRVWAVLKNIGSGSTPHRIPCSVTARINGKVVGWSTPAGPMRVGEEKKLLLDDGPGGWIVQKGSHVLTCIVDDINRLPGENKYNNIRNRTLVIHASYPGMLLGSLDPHPGIVDLTKEGTLDWVHWGANGQKDQIVRKQGGSTILPELEKIGTGHTDGTLGCATQLKWADGDPVLKGDNTYAGLWWNVVGTGYRFRVKADTRVRVLKIYVSGIEGAKGRLAARLSDDSAPPYVSEIGGNSSTNWAAIPDGFGVVYTVHYRSASDNQYLEVEWSLIDEPNQFLGQLRLQAATLANE